MDIWEELYRRAEKEYHPEDVTPFVYAHHVVCALESEDGRIYTGFCIEACSGVMNLCAERVAACTSPVRFWTAWRKPNIIGTCFRTVK